jgi:glycosyltransferase involved in cell wall biosynthesis
MPEFLALLRAGLRHARATSSFDRMTDRPKISVLTASFNGGHFLQETLDSVSAQTFTNFEHVVVDGASKDDSVAILERHARRDPRLRWISEPDGSPEEGFRKAIDMARGEYIMLTCVSDGYLSKTWFQRCADVLDNDRETSLVWGVSANMSEEGDLIGVIPYKYLERSAPQQRDFFEHWAVTGDLVPELNYCVRRNIYTKHFPRTATDMDASVAFVFAFHTNGYLVKFLPIIANFGRNHGGQLTETRQASNARAWKAYRRRVREYRNDLIKGSKRHVFRDGDGEPIGELTRAALLRLRFFRTARLVSAATARVRRRIAKWNRSLRKRLFPNRRTSGSAPA